MRTRIDDVIRVDRVTECIAEMLNESQPRHLCLAKKMVLPESAAYKR